MESMRNKNNYHRKSEDDDNVDDMDKTRNMNNYHHKDMKVRTTTM